MMKKYAAMLLLTLGMAGVVGLSEAQALNACCQQGAPCCYNSPCCD